MQGVLPVLCFIAGFALAWIVLRNRLSTLSSRNHVLVGKGLQELSRWLDFRFVTRFDSSGEGRVDGTLDGRKIVNYRGPTLFQPAHGYPRHALIYFKTGLYRDALHEPPWTMYVDEYRKDQCPESGCR